MPIQSAKSVAAAGAAGQSLSPNKGDIKEKDKANFDLAALKGEQRLGRGERSSARGEAGFDKAAGGLDAGRTLDSGRSQDADRTSDTLRPSDKRSQDLGKFNLPLLREGAKDKPEVALAQKSLNALGYGECKADGKFGPKTTETVRSFQIDHGLKGDGVIGNRETWPAMNKALTLRHEGLTRLGDAIAGARTFASPAGNAAMGSVPMGTELKQIDTILAEFSKPAVTRGRDEAPSLTPTLTTRPSGEMVYVNRGSETLADVGRMFGIPFTAMLASNPDIEKPYLILAGQEIILPKIIKDRFFRKPARQLHPADPDGHLANLNMNPEFVARVNGMIEQLRGEGFDIRVMSGFRTFREQRERFEQGRTATGSIVTDFEEGHSWHNYGLAADMALNDDDGNSAWPEESSPYWQRLGDVAVAHGVIWGGVFGYPDHLEFHPGYGTNEAVLFVEDFESYGLDAVWERIDLDLPDESPSD